MLRVVENSYPPLLPAADAQTGRISALQRVVLVSTLRKGFCMDLRLTQPGVTGWQVLASGSTGVWISSLWAATASAPTAQAGTTWRCSMNSA